MSKLISILKLTALIYISFIFTSLHAQRQMEQLSRGVVAIKVSGGVFVSWRVMGNEWKDISYNLYRESTRLNTEPITGASNWLDPDGTTESIYSVSAIINDIEQPASNPAGVWGTNYKNVPLQIPPGGTTPDGVNYTYNANDCSTGDLDGDGDYEIVLKWDPSNSKDNSQDGYTGNVYLDAYELDGTKMWRIDLGRNIRAGAHYTQFMIYDLDGNGRSEIACKTADATIDGTGVIIGNSSADYRNTSGYILSGPEFLTIFDGGTGKALVTTNYDPPRGTVSSWGDSYGNRVDRFLACIAYLDGKHPSLVMCRGYYTRAVLAAWDWRDGIFTKRWVFDTNNGYSNYRGQGNHNISVADVDDDGKDEIIYGACAIDDDGTGLWTTGLGHGDAMHVSDIDISRPGLEKWGIHENPSPPNPGSALLDARTGQIIWKTATADVGRGVSADLTAEFPGMECWGGTTGLRSSANEYAGNSPSSSNHVIWWDGDDLRELLDATSINKYDGDLLLFATGCLSNNGTKSNPSLQADLLGDWREEVIFRLADNSALRLYVTTNTTPRRLYTLMHDPQYRLGIAWQNVAYNQPPHTGFFLGNGMDSPPPPPVYSSKLTWKEGLTWDLETSRNWICTDTLSWFSNGDDVLFDISGSNTNPIELNGNLYPSSVTAYSPIDYTFNGPGSLSGSMGLLKAGSGTLTLNSDNDYSGKTEVWGGTLLVNGNLSQSSVEVKRSATVGGAGIFGKGLTINKHGNLIIGTSAGSADTLHVSEYLNQEGRVNMYFDLSGDTSGISRKNDILIVDGDLNLTDTNSIFINMLEGYLNPGTYKLIKYSGNFNNTIDNFLLNGLTGVVNELRDTSGVIELFVFKVRDPQSLIWTGTSGNVWDLARTINWMNSDTPDWFVTNDTVLFDDSAVSADIKLTGNLPVGKMSVNASINYSFSGNGSICGTAGITKSGTGRLKINSNNNYSGPTIINNGVLEIPRFTNSGIPGPLGTAIANPFNLIINNATLVVTGTASETDRGLTIGESWCTINTADPEADIIMNGEITGSGKLNKTGTGRLTLTAMNTYTGGTYLKEGIIYLGNDNANMYGLGTGPVTIENATLQMFDYTNSNAFDCYWDIIIPEGSSASLRIGSRCALTGSLTGTGTLNIYTPFIRAELLGDWSGYNGKINVTTDTDGGTFILGNNKSYAGTSINLAKNVTMIYRYTANDTINLGDLSGVSESVMGAGGEGTATITWRIGSGNANSTFNGKINEVQFKNSGAKTSIIKTGTGSWTLTNSNTYTGNTLVERGILLIKNTSGSGTGTGQVTVGNTATLSGTGTIEGPVIISDGGAISVNTSEIGIFTLNNDLILQPGSYCCIDLDPVGKSSDRLIVSGKMKVAGILYLINSATGSYSAGDSFRIFDASSYSGTFELIAPLSPGAGLQWDTTGLSSTGYIHIIESPVFVNEEFQEGTISIYPNPSSRKLYILLPDGIIPDEAKTIWLRCYDELGKLCNYRQMPVSGNNYLFEYDVSMLDAGNYFIVITTENQSYSRKFVKK